MEYEDLNTLSLGTILFSRPDQGTYCALKSTNPLMISWQSELFRPLYKQDRGFKLSKELYQTWLNNPQIFVIPENLKPKIDFGLLWE